MAGLVLLAACSTGGGQAGEDPDAGDAAITTPAPAASAGGGEDTESGDFDLCAVLTLEEINAATGAQATATDGVSLGAGQYSCNYNGDDQVAVAGHTFTTTESGVSPVQMFDANAVEGVRVSGVGDDAVMVGDDDFPMLWALVDGDLYALTVIADNLDGDGKRRAIEELARIAVGRLP